MFTFVYKNLLKPLFFTQDPEKIHDTISNLGTVLGKFGPTRALTKAMFHYQHPSLEQTVAGVHFKNPVGLSAGFDKKVQLLNILPAVGFGFMEVGSITLKPYAGNTEQRLHRLKKSKALVVYYGLKNDGVEISVERIKKAKPTFPICISVAKTNSPDTVSTEAGITDYVECLKYIAKENVGDYIEINISCPNTFGGEPFTSPDKLEMLMTEFAKVGVAKPVFVKMPINLSEDDFDNLLKVLLKYKVTGVVIGNLNKDRTLPSIKDPLTDKIKGGISGLPTQELSNKLISYTYRKYGDKLVIIGVGGIFSAEDAYTKIKLGATLVELITGMIFEGPALIGNINRGLVKLLEQDGFTNIGQAVGADNKSV